MSEDRSEKTSFFSVWLVPFTLIFAISAILFISVYAVDYSLSTTTKSIGELFFSADREAAENILGSVAEVVAAVLGIAITVVAIIVELAANRYTSRVTDLFIQDRVNFMVMALFVVTTLLCLWTGSAFRDDFSPLWEVRVTLVLMTISLLLLLPYFNYVFKFLQPSNIIRRIREQVTSILEKQTPNKTLEACADDKQTVMTAAEQITDIALNSILQRDRGLAMNSTLVLREVVQDSIRHKSHMPDAWFKIDDEQRNNPDFVTLSRTGLGDIESDKNWLEFKVFRQFNLIFAQSLNQLRDLNNLIAMCFRDLGIAANQAKDEGTRRLTINFFNTILRATLNSQDLRTAYNVLHQYRQLCSHMIEDGQDDVVLAIFKHFKYYGLLFDSRGMGFILETCAYDLYRLMTEAAIHSLDNEQKLIAVFLEVDRPPDPGSSDRHLRGVRKAQAMLGAFYLQQDKLQYVRKIALDMAVEPQDRLKSIRDEILNAKRRFWEITDRGVNFDFLQPDLRDPLCKFFDDFIPEAKEKLKATENSPQTATESGKS